MAWAISGGSDRSASRGDVAASAKAAEGDGGFPSPTASKRPIGGNPLSGRKGAESIGATGDLLALSHDAGSHRELTLIDARQRVMAVYHVNGQSGEVSLRSVRAIGWDLMMDDFNGEAPSPREIRSLVEQQ